MRAKGGLMGYPNPAESPYDLFLTGHAGCSVSTALGMKCGDDLLRPDENRCVVAVIGDGAFSSGVVLEAMNHAGGLKKNLIVDPQRQQDVDLPARRRPGRVAGPAADERPVHGPEGRGAEAARRACPCSAIRSSGSCTRSRTP